MTFFCENLRLPAVFCENLSLPNAVISKKAKAKICKNLRKPANLAPLVPFSLSLAIPPDSLFFAFYRDLFALFFFAAFHRSPCFPARFSLLSIQLPCYFTGISLLFFLAVASQGVPCFFFAFSQAFGDDKLSLPFRWFSLLFSPPRKQQRKTRVHVHFLDCVFFSEQPKGPLPY